MNQEELTKRRYRIFLVVEPAFLVITIALWVGAIRSVHDQRMDLVVVPVLAVFTVWHIVAIPIAIFYLIGNPIVMTLVPLVDSAESKAYRAELRGRPALTDEEFISRFYPESEIPQEVIVGVRRSLGDFDALYKGALPADKLYLLYDDIDFADIVKLALKKFKAKMAKEEWKNIDGTLDNLIKLVHRRIGATSNR
jgi:hypothetical protein